MTTGSQSQAQKTELLVRVWGMNAEGRPFFQNALAGSLSTNSAHLTGIEHALKAEEVIGIQYGDKKARFRIVRAVDLGPPKRVQVDVQLLAGQACPWPDEAAAAPSVSVIGTPEVPRASNKRQFSRHKIHFPLELRDQRGGGAAMQTNASDISGRGCYVQTLTPLPLGTPLNVTFWLGADKFTIAAVVRASDPGVGMGIEFIGLDRAGQEHMQKYLENQASQSAAAEGAL